MPLCSIIIVNYNTAALLKNCLKSLFKSEDTGQLEIIVVDNASSDESMAMVKNEFPSVLLIENPENFGFSKANNQGIFLSKGDIILLLNSDTEVYPDSIKKMVVFLNDHKEIGIIGPKVLNTDLTYQATGRMFPGPMNAFFGRKSILTKRFPNNRFSRRYMWCLDEARDAMDYYEVDWVSGACLMIKRAVLSQIGCLDEHYFFYWEDVDLCYRAKKRGWFVYYLNSAVIIHHEGRSGKKSIVLRNRLTKEFYKGAYRYYCKHKTPNIFNPMRYIAFIGIWGKGVVVFLVNNIKAVRDGFYYG